VKRHKERSCPENMEIARKNVRPVRRNESMPEKRMITWANQMLHGKEG